MPIHFSLGYAMIRGVLVEQIGSGVVTGRIELDGGRTSALLVATQTGPRAVRHADVRP
jgi:hypothetical protein